MPFIVTEPCIECKHTDCVDACPMDCFVEGPNFMVIDPAGCIDCSVCVPECPVDAIVNAAEANEAQQPYIALNARLAKHPGWHALTVRKPALAGHAAWAAVTPKHHRLQLGDGDAA